MARHSAATLGRRRNGLTDRMSDLRLLRPAEASVSISRPAADLWLRHAQWCAGRHVLVPAVRGAGHQPLAACLPVALGSRGHRRISSSEGALHAVCCMISYLRPGFTSFFSVEALLTHCAADMMCDAMTRSMDTTRRRRHALGPRLTRVTCGVYLDLYGSTVPW